jgi:hypothetical protein
MSYREELIKQSLIEFRVTPPPSEVEEICLKFISEFHVQYLIYPLSENEETTSTIEEALHDILTNMGVKKDDLGNVIGFRFNISYKFFDSRKQIENNIEGADFFWIYMKS